MEGNPLPRIPGNALDLLDKLLDAVDALKAAAGESISIPGSLANEGLIFESVRRRDQLSCDLLAVHDHVVYEWYHVDPLKYCFQLIKRLPEETPAVAFIPKSIVNGALWFERDLVTEPLPDGSFMKAMPQMLKLILWHATDMAGEGPVAMIASHGWITQYVNQFRRDIASSLEIRASQPVDVFAEMWDYRESFRMSRDGRTCWAILEDGTGERFELSKNQAVIVDELYASYLIEEGGLHRGYLTTRLKGDKGRAKDPKGEDFWDNFDGKTKVKFRRLIGSVPGRQGFLRLKLMKFK